MKALTIGELARRTGLGVEAIRFYERRGLVRHPARPVRGFRIYPQATVVRIRFIRQAQALGFTLREIAALLALRVAPGADCAAVRARAAAKLADVDARVEELGRIRGALAKLLSMCPGRGAVAHCTILEALDSAAESRQDSTRERAAGRRHGGKNMKSLELGIEGMHCDGCAGTIEALLASEPGVKAASVSFAARKGRILYEPSSTNLATLTAAIEKAGYRVSGELEAGAG